MGTNTVRRNLFHHHSLSRRPASETPVNPNSAQEEGDSIASFSSRVLRSSSSDAAASTLPTAARDNGEIAVKDKNGSYKIDMPRPLPVFDGDDGDEMENVDEPDPRNESSAGETSSEAVEISRQEKQSMFLFFFFFFFFVGCPHPMSTEIRVLTIQKNQRSRQTWWR